MSEGSGGGLMRERFYVVGEIKELARVSDPHTVLAWLKSGRLRGNKVGRRWLVAESDLRAFLGR